MKLSKMRRQLWLMGLVKIPLIGYVRPKLITLNDQQAQIQIKLNRRTKNHLNSMYFGALAVGADIAAGIHAYYFAEQSNTKVSFVFKAVKAEFLQRATSNVIFETQDGNRVSSAFKEAVETKERVNKWVRVEALNTEREVVAVFEMEISIKVSG